MKRMSDFGMLGPRQDIIIKTLQDSRNITKRVLKKIGGAGQWWRMPLIPARRRQRQADLFELEANLVYKS